MVLFIQLNFRKFQTKKWNKMQHNNQAILTVTSCNKWLYIDMLFVHLQGPKSLSYAMAFFNINFLFQVHLQD